MKEPDQEFEYPGPAKHVKAYISLLDPQENEQVLITMALLSREKGYHTPKLLTSPLTTQFLDTEFEYGFDVYIVIYRGNKRVPLSYKDFQTSWENRKDKKMGQVLALVLDCPETDQHVIQARQSKAFAQIYIQSTSNYEKKVERSMLGQMLGYGRSQSVLQRICYVHGFPVYFKLRTGLDLFTPSVRQVRVHNKYPDNEKHFFLRLDQGKQIFLGEIVNDKQEGYFTKKLNDLPELHFGVKESGIVKGLLAIYSYQKGAVNRVIQNC